MESQHLCLSCGLCCDGTLFADVKLTKRDLERLPDSPEGASRPRIQGRKAMVPQPCFAFKDGCCSIYDRRPNHCGKFDCDLLIKVRDGWVDPRRAAEIIRTCRRKADEVRQLLAALGDANHHLALTERFRKVSRRMEADGTRGAVAVRYGELTIAMHELHVLLSKHIYPV